MLMIWICSQVWYQFWPTSGPTMTLDILCVLTSDRETGSLIMSPIDWYTERGHWHRWGGHGLQGLIHLKDKKYVRIHQGIASFCQFVIEGELNSSMYHAHSYETIYMTKVCHTYVTQHFTKFLLFTYTTRIKYTWESLHFANVSNKRSYSTHHFSIKSINCAAASNSYMNVLHLYKTFKVINK